MAESGIEIDFGSLLADMEDDFEFDGHYGELRSSSFVDKPEPMELKNVSTPLRVNLKMQLQKQQMQDQDNQRRAAQTPPRSLTSSTAIQMPITVSALTGMELPPDVRKYNTKLTNPIKYHVKQIQANQVKNYLSQSLKDHLTVGSMPVTQIHSPITHHPGPHRHTSSSSMPDPTSPLSVLSSSAASNCGSISEVDDMLSDILNLETVDPSQDPELGILLSSTLPPEQQQVGSVPDISIQQTSASAPNPLDHELITWAKDRQKKDNHNQIERRRRYNINDRIKELGTLLPNTSDPDFRQNKGSILKASVDYIKELKHDQIKMKKMEERMKDQERQNRLVMLRLQQCEMMLKQAGMMNGQPPNPIPVKVEPADNIVEFLEGMDTHEDPMLSSSAS